MREAGNDAAAAIVVLQLRHRPDQCRGIRRPDHRTIDDALDPGLGQQRDALEGAHDVFLDTFEVLVQQLVTEIHRCAVFGPVASILFISADQQPLAFLTQVVLAVAIGDQRQAKIERLDLGDGFGDEILVLERHQRQLDTRHCRHFARPQSGRIDDHVGANRALVGFHLPAAVGARTSRDHGREAMHFRTALARAPGVGMGHAGRIDIAAIGLVHDAANAVEIGQWMHAFGLGARQFVELDLEILRLGRLHAQLMFAIGGLREIQRARLKNAAVLSGFALEVFVELHRVILQPRDIVVIVQSVNTGCRMPGRARSQFVTLEQHHVGPAKFGQVIENRASDQATADDDCLSMGFHGVTP